MTSETPAARPIASAVLALSPVSMTTWMPMFLSSAIAFALSALIVSATAMMPRSFPSSVKRSGVLPSSASASALALSSAGIRVFLPTKERLPPMSVFPPRTAVRPFPGSAENEDTSSASILRSSAPAMTAFASGCSLFISREAAFRSSSFSEMPSAGMISVTLGAPSVIVPVLSSATISTLPASCRASAFLKRMPFFAPMPLPTMIATGVARPSAQGQETTRTEIPLASANPKDLPTRSQIAIVTSAIPMTAGTNTPEIVSASFATGALVAAASETILMIWASVVSSPTRVASHVRNPDWFRVADETVSPGALSTGRLSPVRADSLTADVPEMTTPSTGIFSPGRTT